MGAYFTTCCCGCCRENTDFANYQCELEAELCQLFKMSICFGCGSKFGFFKKEVKCLVVIIYYHVTVHCRYIETSTCFCLLLKEETLTGLNYSLPVTVISFVIYFSVDLSTNDYDFSFPQTSFPIVCV